MAFADWLLAGAPDAVGVALLHSSLASPLAGHGTHCRAPKQSGANETHEIHGRCLHPDTMDLAATVSSVASAFVRVGNVVSGNTATAGVFLHNQNQFTANVKGDPGYNLTLHTASNVTTLRLYSSAPTGSGKSGFVDTVVSSGLLLNKWYRIKLERLYVDATNLRIISSLADPAVDEDAWTVVNDQTLDSTNPIYYGGAVQPRMGWRAHNAFNSRAFAYVDGWEGGQL